MDELIFIIEQAHIHNWFLTDNGVLGKHPHSKKRSWDSIYDRLFNKRSYNIKAKKFEVIIRPK